MVSCVNSATAPPSPKAPTVGALPRSLGCCSRRNSTSSIPGVVFQTRLSVVAPGTTLPPPSLESYRLHPCNRPAYMQSSVLKPSCIIHTLRLSALASSAIAPALLYYATSLWLCVALPSASMQSCARRFLGLTKKSLFLKAS